MDDLVKSLGSGQLEAFTEPLNSAKERRAGYGPTQGPAPLRTMFGGLPEGPGLSTGGILSLKQQEKK